MIRADVEFARALQSPARAFSRSAEGFIEAPGIRIELDADTDCWNDQEFLLMFRGEPYLAEAGRGESAGSLAGTLAASLRAKPEATLRTLRGRFAAFWVDLRAMTVGLACDRFGTYSLCYSYRDGRMRIAERADIVAGPDAQMDPQSIFNYLHFHCIPSPRTIFCDVFRLEQGSILSGDSKGCRSVFWWKPEFREDTRADFDGLRDEFRSIIRSSVERAASGHRTAAYLSGGTDSSTVLGMLRDVTGGAPRGYSIGFDAQGYDEMEYAKIAARHFGADHRAYYVTPRDLVDGIPTVACHYDQPFGNSSALPAYYLAKLAKADGYERLLAGDGGDELFGGNSRYAKQRVFGWYDAIPPFVRASIMEPLLLGSSAARRLPPLRKAASYVEQARVPMPERLEMYNLLTQLTLTRVFDPDFLQGVDSHVPVREQRICWDRALAQSQINRNLAFDWKFTLADNDLPKVTGTTALAGIEVSFPLLSDELVDFSLKVPPHYKLRGLKLRWFFKEALRGFLPDEILTKKKHGFGLPFGHWVMKDADLGAIVDRSLQGMSGRGIVRPDFLRELRRDLLPQAPGYYGEMIWILMMLEQWLEGRARSGSASTGEPAIIPPIRTAAA